MDFFLFFPHPPHHFSNGPSLTTSCTVNKWKPRLKLLSNFWATFRFFEQLLSNFMGNSEQLFKTFGASCGQPYLGTRLDRFQFFPVTFFFHLFRTVFFSKPTLLKLMTKWQWQKKRYGTFLYIFVGNMLRKSTSRCVALHWTPEGKIIQKWIRSYDSN
jgi:hypothetical protein